MSAKDEIQLGNGTMYFVKVWCLLITGVMFVAYLSRSSSVAFDFHYTAYALLPLGEAIFMLALLVLLNLPSNRNRVTFWYSVYMSIGVVWAVGQAAKVISDNSTTYTFWHNLTFPPTGMFLAPILLIFVLAYLREEHLIFRFSNWVIIFGSSLFLFVLSANTNLLYNPAAIVRDFYGYPSTPPLGPLGDIFSLLIIGIFVSTLTLLVRYYRTVAKGSATRKQVRLLVIGISLPIALGTVTLVILPVLGLPGIPSDIITWPLSTVLVTYAMLRYKLFGIDPATLSSTVLATMSEAVVTVNSSYEVEYLNPASVKLLGQRAEHSQGHPIIDLFGHANAAKIVASFADSDSEALDLDVAAGEGTMPISLQGTRILGAGNNLVGYVLVFHDTSREHAVKLEIQRKVNERTQELTEEHARLQAAIDGLDVGLLMTFSGRQNISYNTMLPQILGLQNPSKDTTIEDLELDLALLEEKLLPSKFDLNRAIDECQRSGKPFEVNEITYGKQILRIFGAPIMVGVHDDVIGTVVLIEDVTEAKVMERSKDEFFSIASHELRTPLTSIKGNISMILQYYPEVLKDKSLSEMLNDVHESSVRLISIVNDFLDVSRLEQSRMTFAYEAVRADEVLEAVVYEMQALLKEKKLHLKLDKLTLGKLPPIWADKNRFKQVVYNLVGNSAKFTDKGGITLSAKVEGDQVKFLVVDTGRGMTVASQQLLFHKFQQASSSLITRDTAGGTGLGLYISKMIVESMGGKITLEESVEGKGSTFSFSVPIATPERQAATAAAAATAQVDAATGQATLPKIETKHK